MNSNKDVENNQEVPKKSLLNLKTIIIALGSLAGLLILGFVVLYMLGSGKKPSRERHQRNQSSASLSSQIKKVDINNTKEYAEKMFKDFNLPRRTDSPSKNSFEDPSGI